MTPRIPSDTSSPYPKPALDTLASIRAKRAALAEIVRMGWFREVQVKSLWTHEQRALLAARHRLVETRVNLDNPLRGAS